MVTVVLEVVLSGAERRAFAQGVFIPLKHHSTLVLSKAVGIAVVRSYYRTFGAFGARSGPTG